MAEIRNQAIRNIGHCRRDPAKAPAERDARFRQLETLRQLRSPRRRASRPRAAFLRSCPRPMTRSPTAAPLLVTAAPEGTCPIKVTDIVRGTRGSGQVAAQQDHAELLLIHAQAAGEAFQPQAFDIAWQGQVEKIGIGRRSHGREIGQVDPEQPPTQRVGWFVLQKMYAGDHRIGCNDRITSHGTEAEPRQSSATPGTVDRSFQAAQEFPRSARIRPEPHFSRGSAASNSPGRIPCARRSSTPFTIPVPGRRRRHARHPRIR